MKIIKKIALIIIQDKKILMARSHANSDVYYFIGGKVEEEESEKDCLIREVKEEIGVALEEKTIHFLHEFQSEAYGQKDTVVHIKLYDGTFTGTPHPQNEIAELRYFDSSIEEKYTTPITNNIMAWLQKHGYIT